MMIFNFLAVGAGAAVGGCMRYALTWALSSGFPLGTLASNLIASLAIGFIIGTERSVGVLPERIKLLLTTGLLGGLSTFSTFSLETVTMLEQSQFVRAGGNVLLNVALCLMFVVIGLALAKLIFAHSGAA
ncbi:MAG: fluoride efflux transporter CrcB [Peptococcaceae bacterium]|jgi:CrcB protein|nr:fluoride efflux transporter CrcB [Peptococcaceae bacterium]